MRDFGLFLGVVLVAVSHYNIEVLVKVNLGDVFGHLEDSV